MKIHNVTMTTPDKQQIIVSSNVETTLAAKNGKGPVLSKTTIKGPKGSSRQGSTQLQPLSPNMPQQVHYSVQQDVTQQSFQAVKLAVSSSVQLVTSSQSVATLSSQSSSRVAATYSTTCRPIPTPIPIASKPTANALQANTTGQTVVRAATPGINLQSQTLIPAAQSPSPMKNVSAILLQSIPSSHYGMTLVNAPTVNNNNNSGKAAAASSPSVHTTTGGFLTTFRNLAPPHNTQNQAPQQTSQQPTAFQYAVLRTNQSGVQPSVQSAPPAQLPVVTATPQAITIGQTGVQPNQRPTQVQYILPSLTLQPGTGKLGSMLQMALPGTPVPQGNIQLTFPGTSQPPHTPTGKIQLASPMGIKMAGISPASTPSPAPALTPPAVHHVNQAKVLQNVPGLQQQQQLPPSQTLHILNQTFTNGGQTQPQTPTAIPQIVSVTHPAVAMTTGQPTQFAMTNSPQPVSHHVQQQQQSQRFLMPTSQK